MRLQAALLLMVGVCHEAAAEPVALLQGPAPRFMETDSQDESPAEPECQGLLEEAPVFDAKRDRFLVFTSPKAGSNTFQRSMESSVPGMKIEFAQKKLDKYDGNYSNIKTHDPDVAIDYLQKVPHGTTVFVVSLTRHIYARSISTFFQTLCPPTETNKVDVACIQEYQTKDTGAAVDGLIRKYRADHISPGLWMQPDRISPGRWMKGFQPVVGVDPLACDFNRSEGKLVLQTTWPHLKLIVVILRLEDMERWQSLLEPMVEGVRIEPDNIGSEKWYNHLYHRFKEVFKYTDAELTMLNDEDDLTHFYSTEEQAGFRASEE